MTDVTTKEKAIALNPNPVVDQLNVQYRANDADYAQLQLIDIQGRVVLQQILSNEIGKDHMSVSVSNLKQGIYLCRLQTGNQIETAKFVKL